MKVEVKESSKKSERPFPKLMISKVNKSILVLFTAPTEGTIIQSKNNDKPVGFYSRDFGDSYFEDFEGEITLSNA